ncbi:hypothetical protein FRC01_011130 [Tulasnella sp. 417]|nr:hypothetical protein FRC01_011130 [Tulasnella sp. 417]
MSLSAGSKGNFVSRYFTTHAASIRGELDDDDLRLYHKSLKGRRTSIICFKIFFNILFLFAWSYITLNDNAYPASDTLLGKSFWVDFYVYIGVSLCLPFFSFIGLWREGIVLSHLWFEVAWLLGVSGFDGYLMRRQATFWPSFQDYGKVYFDDPYLALSKVSFALSLLGLLLDLIISLGWSGYLLVVAFLNHRKYRTIWVAEVQNFPWLLPRGLPDRFPGPVRFIFGAPRQTPASKSIPAGLKRLVRGTVALAAWVAIIAYAIFNCVINPLHQFTGTKGLPTRSLLQDSHDVQTFGNITGFIALNVAPLTQFLSDSGDLEYPDEMVAAIVNGIKATAINPLTGEETACDSKPDGTPLRSGNDTADLQIEARWDCGAIWDEIKFRTSTHIPDSRPYVSVSWNSSAYSTRPILDAGLGSIHFNRPNITSFENVFTGKNDNPNEVEPGVTFTLDAGQDLQVNVGRRRDYNVRATFLDFMGGFSQPPSVYVTYPILSVITNSTAGDPDITTLRFYPAFSAYNDELYAQYLEQTVISGLTKTGGLYSSFEVVFVLFFGRSLLAALFGKNNMNPFGRIATTIQGDIFRKRLQEAYPGIDGEDPRQRAEATCNFMHDFILDLKPLEIKRTYMTSKQPDGLKEVGAGSDVTGGEKDIEAAQGTPSIRLHYDDGSTDRSGKV